MARTFKRRFEFHLLAILFVLHGFTPSTDAQGKAPLNTTIRIVVPMPVKQYEPWRNQFQLNQILVKPVFKIAEEAVKRMQLLPPTVKLDFNWMDSECSDVLAPQKLVDIYCDKRIDAIIGFSCSYALAMVARLSWQWEKGVPLITTTGMATNLDVKRDYRLLTRLSGSYRPMTQTIFKYLMGFKWGRIMLLCSSNTQNRKSIVGNSECEISLYPLSQLYKNAENMRELGTEWNLMKFDAYSTDLNFTQLLIEGSKKSNVFLFCADMNTVRSFLVTAKRLGMVDSGRYAFIVVDLMTEPTWREPWIIKDAYNTNVTGTNEEAKEAFRGVKFLSLRRPDTKEFLEFESEAKRIANRANYEAEAGKEYLVSNFLSSYYDAVILYCIALNETLEAGGDILNGTEVTRKMWNRTFQGINGEITIDGNGDRVPVFSIMELDPDTGLFREQAYYDGEEKEIKSSRNVSGEIKWFWPVGGQPPPNDPVCGHDMALCPEKGIPPWAWTLIALGIVTVVFSIVSFFIFRHYKLEAELAAMTWRVRWEELSGEDRVREKKEKQHPLVGWIRTDPEETSSLLHNNHSGSRITLKTISSNGTARTGHFSQQIFTKTASFKGTMVAIKKLNIDRPKIELSRPLLLQLKKMKDIAHDHVTRFVGACVDYPHYCVVTEYCPKGSLQDIIENESIELDKMMIYSLIHDLVKGLDFIHNNSDLKSHGNLKSSNCVVDSRFVLKVTDFGLHDLHSMEEAQEEDEFSYWKRKLWTAPELLRLEVMPVGGTPKGDIYSLGIILHEMLYREGVFYLRDMNLNPQEIVKRLMAPIKTPLRPSCDEDMEMICDKEMKDLMIRCWADSPLERVDMVAVRKVIRSLNRQYETSNIVDNLLKRMEQYANNLEELVQEKTSDYVEEKQKVENLLHQLLPKSVAGTLIRGEAVKAEAFEGVTIYFSDIVGFTSLSSRSTPMQVVALLNDLYTCFDATIEEFEVYKVETIGDAYMVVSGLPERIGDRHASEIAKMSLALLARVKTFKIRHVPEEQLKLRIGLHSGPVVAGVVGSKMPRYCLFGDTVNTASRMESNGLPLKIHISSNTKEILEQEPEFKMELRGEVEMKGKGIQTTYWLTSYGDRKTGVTDAPDGLEESGADIAL